MVPKPRPKKLTPEERAARDERDARLLQAFVRMEEPVGEQVAEIVAEYAYAVAKRYRPWLIPRWDDFRSNVLERLFRDRAEKKLRLDETLFKLARRLVKAEGDKEVVLIKHENDALSFDDDTEGAPTRDWLETAATLSSPQRFPSPERAVAARELRDWLISGAGALGEGEREVFGHEVAVCHGEHETLGKALGINESTARSRLLRFRRELGAFAETTGAVDLAERLGARMHGRPEPPPPVQPERPTRPGHRLEELVSYRAGALPPAEKEAIEKHLPTCAECQRSLRALDATRDAFEAFLIAPMAPWDVAKLVAALERKYPPHRGSVRWKVIGAAGLALVVAAAAVVFWPSAPPPPKPPPPRPPHVQQQPSEFVPINQRPINRQPLMAPVREPEQPDAGADGGR